MAAVAKRYAKALFEVAKERGELDQAGEELNQLSALIKQEEDLARFLNHPAVPKQAKKELLEQAFQSQLSPAVYRLTEILMERDRLDELADVARYYTQLLNEERGLVEAVVSTAVPLTGEKQEELKQILNNLTAKQINLVPVVNPDLLGGISVKIGDVIFDGSLRGKLSRFERMIASSKS
jgi:F-type H+-transporting ATPase subunit delta